MILDHNNIIIILCRLVEEIRGMAEVKYVERSQVVHALQTQCEVQNGATWGLVRTTLRDWNTNPNDPPNGYEHDKEGESWSGSGFRWDVL